MGIVLDLTPVEQEHINLIRKSVDMYEELVGKKSVWIKIVQETGFSPAGSIDHERLVSLLTSNTDVNMSFTLDKDWDVLHYLLTGSVEDVADMRLSKAILGGEKIHIETWHNYPPVLLSPAETKAVASELNTVREEHIQARFDPAIITTLFFNAGDDPKIDAQNLAHVKEVGYACYYHQITKIAHYYQLAAERSMGMVKSFS
jgi:hypothetical protein